MNYAQGFAQGEADSFRDRKLGVPLEIPEMERSDYQRGYWDGYTPRSPSWGAMVSTPAITAFRPAPKAALRLVYSHQRPDSPALTEATR